MEIAYAATQKITPEVSFSTLSAIGSASWPVQLTLLLLASMSVASWAIIFTKNKSLNETRAANSPFLDLFWKASSLDDIFSKLETFPNSNIARLFQSGYTELRKMADSAASPNDKAGGTAPLLSGIDNLERALQKAIELELTRLEVRINFLATTGSIGPFIGLFGTVWGIMGAFHKIGSTGMANLAVVAPGISEALIATAIGLAVAIPATVAFNHFSTRIQREELELKSFAADFLNIAKRNFFKNQ
jgi:biopolymer transport protein TolQ